MFFTVIVWLKQIARRILFMCANGPGKTPGLRKMGFAAFGSFVHNYFS
jgi:hypothetical protein